MLAARSSARSSSSSGWPVCAASIKASATTVALVYGNNGRSAGDRYGSASDTYGSGGAGSWFPYGTTSPGVFHALTPYRGPKRILPETHPLGISPDFA